MSCNGWWLALVLLIAYRADFATQKKKRKRKSKGRGEFFRRGMSREARECQDWREARIR